VKEISLHIMDIVQNSVEAGATKVSIGVDVDSGRDLLTITVSDNGRGMDSEMTRRVTDPFVTSRTTRRVGLGLSLLKDTARQTGGRLEVLSAEGEGTRVIATLGLSHIDRPPLGDIASTLACLIAANKSIDIDYHHACDGREFSVRTEELRSRLSGVSLADPLVFCFVREYAEQGISQLCSTTPSLLV